MRLARTRLLRARVRCPKVSAGTDGASTRAPARRPRGPGERPASLRVPQERASGRHGRAARARRERLPDVVLPVRRCAGQAAAVRTRVDSLLGRSGQPGIDATGMRPGPLPRGRRHDRAGAPGRRSAAAPSAAERAGPERDLRRPDGRGHRGVPRPAAVRLRRRARHICSTRTRRAPPPASSPQRITDFSNERQSHLLARRHRGAGDAGGRPPGSPAGRRACSSPTVARRWSPWSPSPSWSARNSGGPYASLARLYRFNTVPFRLYFVDCGYPSPVLAEIDRFLADEAQRRADRRPRASCFPTNRSTWRCPR